MIVAAAAAMLVAGLWGLDRGSMWQDEAATFDVAHRTIPQLMAMLRHVDVVHGSYYAFMHVWMLPGGGEVWMRVPSVLAMAVAAGTVAALGVRLAGVRVGVVAGLLFAASPLVSFYAQEGRSFALVTAGVLLGTYCLVRALASNSRRWWLGHALFMVVAVALHEFAVLAVAAHGATVLLSRVRWRTWRWWLASALACAVVVAPVALLSQRQSAQVSWLPRPTWASVAALAKQFFGSSPWLLALIFILVVLGGSADVRLGLRRHRYGVGAVALPLLLVPVVVLLTVSLVQPLFHVRYVLFSLAGVPLLAAQGLEQLAAALARAVGRPAAGWALAGVLIGSIFVAQLPAQQHVRSVESRSNDLADAAAVVRDQAQPDDAVIFMPLRYRAAELGYPAAFARVDDIALDATPVQASNLRGVDRSPGAVRKAMLVRLRIWVVGRAGLRVRSSEKGAVNEQSVLRRYFTKTRSVAVHGMQVALYVKKHL